MLAIIMREFGGPEVLRAEEADDPVPGSGEVVVGVAFASVTFVETQVRSGSGPFGRPPLPRTPGNGVGGRVTAIGDGVDPALLGAVVVTTTGGTGGYAEFARARAADVVPVPPGVDLRDAVALLADGRTALLLTRDVPPLAGETVLVEAAAGGVGSLLVQLAVAAGARVIGAAGGARKGELVAALGAEFVDYTRPGWAGGLGEVDTVFDGVGGAIGAAAAGILRDGGRISVYGMAAGTPTDLPDDQVTARAIHVHGLTGAPSPDENRALIRRALDLAADGRWRPVVGQAYPLTEAAAAHAAIESRATLGKTLLKVGA
ncbi:zinc-binding dehydrogenase [Nonomuraea endophytica]|uniref:NADPH2:quinone reductase n=1 Tax=Nonomuraea endophytica TaxID=714136 RepID=A0A7W8A3R8_9ACTN|nr:zinc-binding dehydrogenase [Nonomuraea endophytica]MBB5079007.1 NADPH2:quinone reductase [Nonomuraea endophytica]